MSLWWYKASEMIPASGRPGGVVLKISFRWTEPIRSSPVVNRPWWIKRHFPPMTATLFLLARRISVRIPESGWAFGLCGRMIDCTHSFSIQHSPYFQWQLWQGKESGIKSSHIPPDPGAFALCSCFFSETTLICAIWVWRRKMNNSWAFVRKRTHEFDS